MWVVPAIRPVALALILRPSDDALLVFDSIDAEKDTRFHRPLGGGIEFAETGADAVKRELKERLGADLIGVRLVGVLENIFNKNGETAHEIVLAYAAEFADDKHYEHESFEWEAHGQKVSAVWRRIAAMQTKDNPDAPPLLPDGVGELARQA